MMKFSVRCLLLCLLLVTNKLAVADAVFLPKKEKHYWMDIKHPGSTNKTIEHLALIENSEGEFYMDVPSVYCHANVCKMDTVRIFWNNIGFYKRFELDTGVKLEKGKDRLFTSQDYEKLHTILQNENSPFKEVQINDIVVVDEAIHGEVDSYSGATVLELDEKESIEGASLTCYTLWNWVHSSIKDSIRRITGDALSTKQLLSYLSKNEKEKLFAIEQLSKKGIYKKQAIFAIINLRIEDNSKLNKLRLHYFEQADSKIYFNSILKIFEVGRAGQKSLYFQSLRKTNKAFPAGFLESLSLESSNFNSYQEVNLFLNLVEEKGISSSVTIGNIMPLLDKNILISRRAYWYLSKQKISPDQQKELDAFRKGNQDYL